MGDPDADEGPFALSLDAQASFGWIDGFVRIPLAGRPGSTDFRRPQIHDLGFDTALVPRLDLGVHFRDFQVHAGAWLLELSGTERLEQDLLTRNIRFPAQSVLRSRIELYLYRFDLRYEFRVKLSEESSVHLTPRLGLLILDFAYRISSGPLIGKRDFTPVNAELGLHVSLDLGASFSLAADFSLSPALDLHNGWPGVLSFALTAEYRVLDSNLARAVVYLGLGFDRIDFEDSQDMPNRIDVNFGPAITVGLRLGF